MGDGSLATTGGSSIVVRRDNGGLVVWDIFRGVGLDWVVSIFRSHSRENSENKVKSGGVFSSSTSTMSLSTDPSLDPGADPIRGIGRSR